MLSFRGVPVNNSVIPASQIRLQHPPPAAISSARGASVTIGITPSALPAIASAWQSSSPSIPGPVRTCWYSLHSEYCNQSSIVMYASVGFLYCHEMLKTAGYLTMWGCGALTRKAHLEKPHQVPRTFARYSASLPECQTIIMRHYDNAEQVMRPGLYNM